MDLDDIYSELIMDHFKNPRGRLEVTDPDAVASVINPLCGDKLTISIRRQDGRISSLGFSGSGCSISQASASMLATTCTGKGADEVAKLCSQFRAIMSGMLDSSDAQELGDSLALEGIKKFPARLRCALLAWEGMEKCLAKLADPK